MPNRKKTTAELKLKGTYRASRHARRNAADPVPINPKPPECLNDAERAAWAELVKAARPYLAQSDRVHVEITARLMASVRAGTARAGTFAMLERCLMKMGIGPDARSRLDPLPRKGAGKSTNPFENF